MNLTDGLLKAFDALPKIRVLELRHCRSLDEARITAAVAMAHRKVKNWPQEQGDGLVTALAMLSNIDSSKTNSNGFIESWAKNSVDKRPNGMDINEHRFMKLIQASDWEEFFNALSVGVKLLRQQDKSVDRESMIREIGFRADNWQRPNAYEGSKQFSMHCADRFYATQPKSRT